jgi:hypothetical protein
MPCIAGDGLLNRLERATAQQVHDALTMAQASRILGYSARMLATLKAVATLLRTAFQCSSLGPVRSVWWPFGDANCNPVLKEEVRFPASHSTKNNNS